MYGYVAASFVGCVYITYNVISTMFMIRHLFKEALQGMLGMVNKIKSFFRMMSIFDQLRQRIFVSVLLVVGAAMFLLYNLSWDKLAYLSQGIKCCLSGLWRYVVVGAVVAAAVLTPSTDPLTQVLLAGPLMGLYLGGAWVMKKQNFGIKEDTTFIAGMAVYRIRTVPTLTSELKKFILRSHFSLDVQEAIEMK
ncbi:hypothetical protein Taro_045636 [Colocasia esculenta]|uniref:Uncharacterized protein n=1 Tax=Colocasia esculenta TaxID=4460 RepID=A0A843WPZ8_COLES|nr:hypothetical protein [Colocasia esculenta]